MEQLILYSFPFPLRVIYRVLFIIQRKIRVIYHKQKCTMKRILKYCVLTFDSIFLISM